MWNLRTRVSSTAAVWVTTALVLLVAHTPTDIALTESIAAPPAGGQVSAAPTIDARIAVATAPTELPTAVSTPALTPTAAESEDSHRAHRLPRVDTIRLQGATADEYTLVWDRDPRAVNWIVIVDGRAWGAVISPSVTLPWPTGAQSVVTIVPVDAEGNQGVSSSIVVVVPHSAPVPTQELPSPTTEAHEKNPGFSPSATPSDTPSQTPSESTSPSASTTATVTLTPTASATPTETATATATATATPTATASATTTPSATASDTPSTTPTSTCDPSASATPTDSPSGTPTVTLDPNPTPSAAPCMAA